MPSVGVLDRLRDEGEFGSSRFSLTRRRPRHGTTNESEEAPTKIFEALDYDDDESEVRMSWLEAMPSWSATRVKVFRWIVVLVIGVITACIAAGIDLSAEQLYDQKMRAFTSALRGKNGQGGFWIAAATLIPWNALFVFISAALVAFVEPTAAGSGIPEIKCYLNGCKLRDVMKLRTLLCKVTGILFSVAGGLPVGKEGPMIHSGAIVGAGVSQGQSTIVLGGRRLLTTPLFKEFRNDREKRDFVTCGTASGVSAAFGAPAGGLLFSLEEGATHWSSQLTWRCFFGAMVSTFSLNFLLSAIRKLPLGTLACPGLITFGDFEPIVYGVQQLPLIAVLGVLGGLCGALFNAANKRLTVFRMNHINRPGRRVVEAVSISCIMSSAMIILPWVANSCIELPSSQDGRLVFQRFLCDEGSYNLMATLTLGSGEQAIYFLFHSKEKGNVGVYLMFVLVYGAIACMTYGIGVPSGLFVPSLLCGAALGRAWGEIAATLYPDLHVVPGIYALLGAASFLGGVARITISLTVVIVEITGNTNYAPPLMMCVILAKWVGDVFNSGLYDMHIALKCRIHRPVNQADRRGLAVCARIPIVARMFSIFLFAFRVSLANDYLLFSWTTLLVTCVGFGTLTSTSPASLYSIGFAPLRLQNVPLLESDPVDGSHALKAEDVMQGGAFCFQRETSAGEIYSTLSQCDQLDFPVLSPNGTYEGLVKREHLLVLLRSRAFSPSSLDYMQLTATYPLWPLLYRIELSDEDKGKLIPLSRYMNPSAFACGRSTRLPRVHRLYRSMGLRTLTVLETGGEVAGLITRQSLDEETLHGLVVQRRRTRASALKPDMRESLLRADSPNEL